MIIFMDLNKKLKEVEKCLDPQLWHVCTGGMVQMPSVNAKVFYFPQGHVEHACRNVDFQSYQRVVPFIPCRVCAVKYTAYPETDEVFVKMRLVQVNANEPNFEDDGIGGINGSEDETGSTAGLLGGSPSKRSFRGWNSLAEDEKHKSLKKIRGRR